jgi:hypothetical protein|tara:strand:+ start:17066 stop:17713 length:648 start_codon:yes stop_codon:yes gene_type:complete
MPITTLTNISIPTEDGGGSNSSLLMPKLQYRFRVLFENFGTTGGADGIREITRQVVDVTRPNLTFEQMTIDAYNSRSYLAGKHTWDPITITLREDANNNVQKIIGQQLQRQFDFFEQSSAVSGGTYKFITKIEILDGGNGANGSNVIDRFQLVGCYLESANYNTLAYATSDAVTTTLSIRYDNAIQYGADEQFTGVGEVVSRIAADGVGGTQVTG